jgi:integrase
LKSNGNAHVPEQGAHGPVATVGLSGKRSTPYALRHSFASLLLHEGRSVVYVARQLGHDARLTLSTYGHVIDELDDAPNLPAEEAIRMARHTSCVSGVSPIAAEHASEA